MTEPEVIALTESLADAVREVVIKTVGPVRDRILALETQMTLPHPAIFALRDRVTKLETREPAPGPPGPPGPPGADGKDGTPGLRYCGVYVDGKSYDLGDGVTWAGSLWHCNAPTTSRPGEASKIWTLMVKRGRDGKDAHGPR